ncbi:MAG: right-handed parallel beta-helix repeat-containing protein, partial [Armatimonadetes bacterium]|nr:right-handed parallel beta-helix repeat-containing protein [Armatimonadota bacterium]
MRMGLTLATLLSAVAAFPQAAPDVQALLDAAIRDKQPTVTLPRGTVRLARGLVLDRAEGLTVEGAGAALVIGDIHSPAVRLSRCKGVTLRGFTVDYDPLPFTQGTVTSRSDDGTQVEFAVHEGYPDLTEDLLQKHAHIFDNHEQRWKRLAPDIYPRAVEALSPRRGRLTLPTGRPYYDQVQPGDRLVLNTRGTSGLMVWQSEDVRVEGVTLLTAPGCGVMCRYMRGDNRFRYDIRPGPMPPGASQPRLMSTCADGFNYAFARRGPVLEDSHFSFMGDDSVNLHGPVLLVTQVVNPTELLVASPYGPEPVDWLVEAGDTARRLQPGNYAILAEAAITAFTREGQAQGEQRDLVQAFWPRVKSNS